MVNNMKKEEKEHKYKIEVCKRIIDIASYNLHILEENGDIEKLIPLLSLFVKDVDDIQYIATSFVGSNQLILAFLAQAITNIVLDTYYQELENTKDMDASNKVAQVAFDILVQTSANAIAETIMPESPYGIEYKQ